MKGRNQRVKINAEYSSWKEILKGVPQGSVLGPLLFNIFINDLFFFVEKSEVCNYADDNSLTVADICVDTIISKLEKDINNLDTWFKHNGMVLNKKMPIHGVIEPRLTSRNEIEKIKLGKHTIEEINNGKLLGIIFDNKLTMHDHIKHICKKASDKLYALARISHYLDKQKRIILMKSFVISQFNYFPIVWMYCQRKSNNLTNRIHERALRIAYNDYTSDFQLLLEKDDSVTIHHKNIQALVIEIYKTVKTLNPDFMKEIFSLKPHNYPLRRQNLVYPNPRTVYYGLESFGYKGSQIWSIIPKEIQTSDDISVVKSYISKHYKDLCKCNLCKQYNHQPWLYRISHVNPIFTIIL